jgi:CRP-like cAMP-binding protein
MLSLFARKLGRYAELTEQEQHWLAGLAGQNIHTARARRDILREGEQPTAAKVILDGWAVQYKTLPDGRRQIVAILLPGDMISVDSILLSADYSVGAATPLTYADVSSEELGALRTHAPAIDRALRIDSVVTAAVQREWIIGIGQRNARERLAHMMCEIFVRLGAVGLVEGTRCEMPLTQCDLAEASGMTPVHVNRTLQELRYEELISLDRRILTIPRFTALAKAGMFNPAYLNLAKLQYLTTPALGEQVLDVP